MGKQTTVKFWVQMLAHYFQHWDLGISHNFSPLTPPGISRCWWPIFSNDSPCFLARAWGPTVGRSKSFGERWHMAIPKFWNGHSHTGDLCRLHVRCIYDCTYTQLHIYIYISSSIHLYMYTCCMIAVAHRSWDLSLPDMPSDWSTMWQSSIPEWVGDAQNSWNRWLNTRCFVLCTHILLRRNIKCWKTHEIYTWVHGNG